MYHYYTMISLLKVNTNSKLLNMSVLETMLFLIKVIYDSVYDTLELNKSKFKSKILVDKYIYLSLSWDIKVSTLQEKIQYAWIVIEDILYVYIYIYHKIGRRSQMTRVFFFDAEIVPFLHCFHILSVNYTILLFDDTMLELNS